MPREEQDRPVHVVVDVRQGAVAQTPVTDDEWDAIDAKTAAAVAEAAQREADEQALREAAAAHPDPFVQALAKRVGLL